jgi:CRP/FNR family transcriptional regulator, anaerobic regulatory protein
MIRILGDEILHNQELILLLGKKTAEERLAAFLLSLHSRFAKHAGPVDELSLSMSRSDIGNYLGIAEETVSRVFTLFRQKGLIALRHRRITLRRPDKLSAIAVN